MWRAYWRDRTLVATDGRTQLGTVLGEPPSAALPNNLPAQLSSFIGRERELRDVGRLISEHRLLTLTGAGGAGKTRLATEAASKALERLPDGAWWVELAPLSDERLVGAAIAESLGVRPLPGMSELQAAAAYLSSRQALIVLDNCEHLAQASAKAAEALLGAAPELVILATSRAPLGASGETEWRVPSLSLPELQDGENGASDAVALFAERALSARPDLALRADDAEHIAAICTELDGLPLAIELAAARVRIPLRRPDRRRPFGPLSPAERRAADGERSPEDDARLGRLELRAARRSRAGPASPPRRLRRRLYPRRGRRGLRR
jgi:hypothetical protein